LVATAKGTVDFLNQTGGYGFISTDDEDDVFFHIEDVGGLDLEEGTEIEFDVEDAPSARAQRASSAPKSVHSCILETLPRHRESYPSPRFARDQTGASLVTKQALHS
jgi:CspA family cold shock protein